MPLPDVLPIRCPRLTVRPVAAEDLPDLLAVNGDDAVTRFLPYPTWRGLDDARAWLARMDALRAAGGAQQLVIERNADARVIGTVLLFKHDEGSARIEIGYAVGRPHWRSGYAREALTGVCRHAFMALGIRRIEAEVNPENIASHELLRALGFVHEGRLRQRWVGKGRAYDTNVYGCLAGEWAAADAPR